LYTSTITFRDVMRVRKFWLTKKELERLYWREKLSTVKIGKLLGFRHCVVLRWTKKYGIPRRNQIEAVRLSNKGRVESVEHKKVRARKISKALKGRKITWGDKISKAKKGKTPPGFSKCMKRVKYLWTVPEWRETMIKKLIKGLLKRPTSLEKKFMKFIEKYNLPFSYCGNGSLLIGYKNPDFVECNGKKICIEVANRIPYHHPKGYAKRRIEHFAKYGWKCIVIWDEELKNEKLLLEKIRNVLNIKNNKI